ncbi:MULTISPECIES: SPL family radical SAM protein [Halomicrobium]|uniref:Radical SAM domain protein n=2 Tax=Halomicrobium mukohataei TaxID=57705 RepID=C7P3L8_HALMD|nr:MULTISPECIES: radical SAM protein [Halomicrobium]ACV47690.1 Radical SAM domain protein [Halomicrobium mukohataei DSM 12286]QCD66143.1 radical SAM protein [Halomicrobium mukohataei]QFR20948.1 radical SAM protein [Halomicrobium sp. ZPS1]
MKLETERDPDGGWYDRFVQLVDDQGHVVEEFGKNPTLNELREAERRHSTRINLWQQGLVCDECGNQINERFSARQDGHLLCWDCATSSESHEQGGLRINADPTKSVLSESKLHKKSLCDYVINVATGCRHGCKFCYVPSTPAVDNRDEMLDDRADVDDPQQDWGDYLLYRDDLPERVQRGLEETDFQNWKTTDRGRGIVMLSSGTDCYQDRRAAQITRGCVHELIEHDIPTRILTRSPNVTRDIDLFKQANGSLTVGSSIPSFDTSLISVLEPNAPPPMARWEALNELFKAGVPRFVSFSPTYPTMGREDIHEALSWFSAIDPEVVFHEPINPRGINFEMCIEALEDEGLESEADEFRKLQRQGKWVDYALDQIEMVRDVATHFENITIHTWPGRDLIEATNGTQQRKFKQMRRQISPEPFAE